MALTKNQREILEFIRPGFENATGICINKYGSISTDDKKRIGILDVGVGNCYWVTYIEQNIETYFSLTKYHNNVSDGALREMNLRFIPTIDEIPKIRLHMALAHKDVYKSNIIQGLRFAKDLTERLRRSINVGASGTDIVYVLTSRETQCYRSRAYKTKEGEELITLTGKLAGHSGIHIAMPTGAFGSLVRASGRKVAAAATEALTKLLRAES